MWISPSCCLDPYSFLTFLSVYLCIHSLDYEYGCIRHMFERLEWSLHHPLESTLFAREFKQFGHGGHLLCRGGNLAFTIRQNTQIPVLLVIFTMCWLFNMSVLIGHNSDLGWYKPPFGLQPTSTFLVGFNMFQPQLTEVPMSMFSSKVAADNWSSPDFPTRWCPPSSKLVTPMK